MGWEWAFAVGLGSGVSLRSFAGSGRRGHFEYCLSVIGGFMSGPCFRVGSKPVATAPPFIRVPTLISR